MEARPGESLLDSGGRGGEFLLEAVGVVLTTQMVMNNEPGENSSGEGKGIFRNKVKRTNVSFGGTPVDLIERYVEFLTVLCSDKEVGRRPAAWLGTACSSTRIIPQTEVPIRSSKSVSKPRGPAA